MQGPEKFLEIARPINSKMTQLRPSPSKEFDSLLSIKSSVLMSLISFLGSMVLHVLFVCIYHRYKLNVAKHLYAAVYFVLKFLLSLDEMKKSNAQFLCLS